MLVRKCLKENEESKDQAAKNSRKLEEFLIQLSGCLEMDMKNEEESQEHLISKAFVANLTKFTFCRNGKKKLCGKEIGLKSDLSLTAE